MTSSPTFAEAAMTGAAMNPDATMDRRRRHCLLWYLVASGALTEDQAEAVTAHAEAVLPNPLPNIPNPTEDAISVYDVLRFLTSASLDNGRDRVPDAQELIDQAIQRSAADHAAAGRTRAIDALSSWALTRLQ